MRLSRLSDLPPSPASEAFKTWRAANPNAGRTAVAYSGGADSTLLLVELARCGVLDGEDLIALHVDHGLQPAAADFAAHCRAFCEALRVQVPTRLTLGRARVDLPPRTSLEAQARKARYDTLAKMAHAEGVETVLLAQHADDQVETVLIALGRGAGPAGLAGMAPAFEHQGVGFARPLLSVAAPAIRGWLSEHAVPFIDDPSNADEQRTRNRLRRYLMPVLEQALPEFRQTFARSARLAHATQELLEELARHDFDRIGDPPRIALLRALSAAHQANVLRYWLRTKHAAIGSEAQIEALRSVVAACTTRGHRIHIKVGEGHVEREGEHLAYRPFL